MSTSREVDILKQWPAGVSSRFAEVTENNILRMQDITIPNNTKKATKLGMKVFSDKQSFNIQLAHMSSVFCPYRQAPLMPLSLNNNCMFHGSISKSHQSWGGSRFGSGGSVEPPKVKQTQISWL